MPTLRAQTVSGVVYRDFNSDGVRTAPANATGVSAGDVGVPGIVVTAYSSNTASAPVSVTTSPAGAYTLTTGPGQFRIEFTNLPQGDQSSFRGAGNGTNVQFITVSNSLTGIDFGINYPQNYCGSQDPEVVTTCFVSGTPTTSTPVTNTVLAGGRDVIVGAPYSTTGDARASHTSIANALAVGSVWGLAYRKTTRQLFSAAFQKRHVGYGPGGPGAVYVTTLAADLQSGATDATPFFNFSTVAGAGTVLHGPLSVSVGEASYDIQSFSLVGKVGLGDIDLSDDEQYLYIVNLFNRRLYQLNIATKDTVSFSIPNNCPTGTSYRPFAVKYHRGKVYVGVVCTQEEVVIQDVDNNGLADTYTATSGLQATVYAYAITGSTATTSVALSFPLTYPKAPSNADLTGQARAELWRPWTNRFLADRLTGGGPYTASYPQPWLTDIEFDVNDDMIVGIRDRYGDQMGYQNFFPVSTNTDLVSVISPGEILRAGKCTYADAWSIESNGSTCTIPASSTVQTTAKGPGSGKFYWGDRVEQGDNHQLSSLGGLAVLGGSGQVIMTAMDPNDIFNTGGLKRLVNATGAKAGESFTTSSPTTGFYLYNDKDIASYGKANGIGDVELLCGPAPVQIGNRVWFDQNQNGIQDPGEPPVAGAVVQLYNSTKTTVLASVTTNAAGEYYFSSGGSSTVTSSSAAVTTALTYNTGYALVISSLGSGLTVSGNLLSLTGVSPLTGESTGTNSGTTISNNDAVVEAGRPCIRFTTGREGGAVHNFDFGLVAPCSVSLTITAERSTSTASVTLAATGCRNGALLWSTGETTPAIVIASGPLTLYSVTCTTGPGCLGTAQVQIAQVPAALDVLVTGGIICGNQSATLTANACSANLLWSTGQTTATIEVNPAVTTVYSVSCSDDLSTVAGSATVIVQGAPAISLSLSSPVISSGESVTITATGCTGGTLVWSAGAASTGIMQLIDRPAATTTYSVTCTTGPQCQAVATATVMVMPPQTPLLTVTKLVSASRARVGDIISYTIVLANTGTGAATNILVRDSVSTGLEILMASVIPSVGTYSPGSPVSVWVVPSLPASSTATFTFSASVTAAGVLYNKASVPGSTASVCTSIPVRVCQGSGYAFQLNAPTGYTRYQWFRRTTPASAETMVYDGTLPGYTVTQAGEYRVVVNDAQGQCPDLSCCPFVVEEDSIPQFTVMAQPPACVNTQPQGNGSLTIMELGTDPGQFTYQVSAGETFTPATALPSVPVAVPANGVILSNLNTTQTYTVRVYNQQGCFRDVTVTLPVTCACPPQVCVPITIRRARVTNP